MANAAHEHNDGKHIHRIIQMSTCTRHHADRGQACWNIGSNFGILKAICDLRARSAGANGEITQDEKHHNAPLKKKEYSR